MSILEIPAEPKNKSISSRLSGECSNLRAATNKKLQTLGLGNAINCIKCNGKRCKVRLNFASKVVRDIYSERIATLADIVESSHDPDIKRTFFQLSNMLNKQIGEELYTHTKIHMSELDRR